MNWLKTLAGLIAQEGAAARAVIIGSDGPTPRAIGSDMIVTRAQVRGRIGRRDVQERAIALARVLIEEMAAAQAGVAQWRRTTARFATGEVLGQPTGGSVTVLVEAFGTAEIEELERGVMQAGHGHVVVRPVDSGRAPLRPANGPDPAAGGAAPEWQAVAVRVTSLPQQRLACVAVPELGDVVIETVGEVRPPFYVYGTGLIARALVDILATLPFHVTWVDTAPGNFPSRVPAGVRTKATDDIVAWAGAALDDGLHAVMTAAHDLDLGICRQVLGRGRFRYLGVIGSKLKRERLVGRLEAEGVAKAEIARMACPIGLDKVHSKNPSVIAVAIAAEALIALHSDDGAAGSVSAIPR